MQSSGPACKTVDGSTATTCPHGASSRPRHQPPGNLASYRSIRPRITTRLDGFVSVHAPYGGGEVLTKPLTFSDPTDGEAAETYQLTLNVSTSAAGSVQVELLDAAGDPIPGYTLSDCDVLFGDGIALPVSWNGDRDIAPLAGTGQCGDGTGSTGDARLRSGKRYRSAKQGQVTRVIDWCRRNAPGLLPGQSDRSTPDAKNYLG